jgi:hypothetical protein
MQYSCLRVQINEFDRAASTKCTNSEILRPTLFF